jgi:two-component system response regulator AtoC
MKPPRNGRGQTICFAEDEAEVRNYLETALTSQGYSVEAYHDGEELLSNLQARSGGVSVVLLDLIMPRKDGIETLREIRSRDRDLPVIIISGAPSPFNVVEAMRHGATDFLGKPIGLEELRKAIDSAIEQRARVRPEAPQIQPVFREEDTFVTANAQMREIEELADQVGWSEAPVLIQGETGTGKEVLARLLHARSQRASKPLVKLNCAALPSELIESELFGYQRGAFTGAFQNKLGMFELADGGTIMLDEIGDMDYKLQAKLLQVLQDHTFNRLGGKEAIQVDVRVMSATHRDLEEAIADGTFRQDLYYRLDVISLHLPALRERREDVLGLAEVLLRKHAAPGSPLPTITPSLRQALLAHDWPGNIRELENLMRKLLVLQAPEMIASELHTKAARKELARPMPPAGERSDVAEPILEKVSKANHEAESEAIMAALNATRWNRRQAAFVLKIDYKALLYKMKKLGINPGNTATDLNGNSGTQTLEEGAGDALRQGSCSR